MEPKRAEFSLEVPDCKRLLLKSVSLTGPLSSFCWSAAGGPADDRLPNPVMTFIAQDPPGRYHATP